MHGLKYKLEDWLYLDGQLTAYLADDRDGEEDRQDVGGDFELEVDGRDENHVDSLCTANGARRGNGGDAIVRLRISIGT